MDQLVKAYWSHCYVHQHISVQPLQPQQPPIYLKGWTVWSGTIKIINLNHQQLYELIHDPIAASKLIRLGHFPDIATLHIDK